MGLVSTGGFVSTTLASALISLAAFARKSLKNAFDSVGG